MIKDLPVIAFGCGIPSKSSIVGATSHNAPVVNDIPAFVTMTGTRLVVCAV